MAKQRYSGKELFDEWMKREKMIRLEREKKEQEKLLSTPKQCKFCSNSFYRKIAPTGPFTETTEICGCREKCKIVDPLGFCELFEP